MGFIERIYNNTMTLLDSLGQTQFEAVASQIGTTTQILSALVAVLVLVNMALQIRPMEAGTSVWLIVKLVLVALFMRSWTDFNEVFSAIEEGFEAIGNALLAGGLGAGETATSFPRELDNLSENMGRYANVTAGRLNILGGMINALMFGAIAFFGALATLAMIASRVVLAVFVALAPFAILCTLTSQTKSYFETWLSAVIKVLMYPLILIGIFATILGMGNATIGSIDPNNITAIGQVTPILTILVLSSFLVILSPIIVTMVTGEFALGGITSVAMKAAGRAGFGAAKLGGSSAKNFGGGIMGSGPSENAGRIGQGANALGNTIRNAASGTGEQVNSRAAQLNRTAARMERLRRK